MTTTLLVRRFTSDVARSPATVFVLVAAPLVFVVAAAGALAKVGEVLGGSVAAPAMTRLTAGWSAAFVSGVAMYFQVSSARQTDQRLAGAGLRRATLVTGRLLTGVVLALAATASALVALLIRDGGDHLGRAAAGTVIFAVVYLGFGAVVGAGVRDPINGTVLLLFVWIVDVFFGPGLNSSPSPLLRGLPTRDAALWVLQSPDSTDGSGHLLRALAWAAGALVLAFLAVLATTARGGRRGGPAGTWAAQLRAGLRMAWHSWRRTGVLWVLLAVVPAVFIWLAAATTPHGTTAVQVREHGATFLASFDPAEIHAGIMAPIAVASLSALAGVFIGVDARSTDRRLVLAGQRPWVVATTRLGTTIAATLLATAAALAVAGVLFNARQWWVYAAGNTLVAITYGLLGLLVGPLVGRTGGTLLAFLVPFVDLALGQSPMLHAQPPPWAVLLPGYGGNRLVVDGGLTASFDEGRGLAIALAWLVAIVVVAVARRPVRQATVGGPPSATERLAAG